VQREFAESATFCHTCRPDHVHQTDHYTFQDLEVSIVSVVFTIITVLKRFVGKICLKLNQLIYSTIKKNMFQSVMRVDRKNVGRSSKNMFRDHLSEHLFRCIHKLVCTLRS